jgi:biopolymer transport protein ExbD
MQFSNSKYSLANTTRARSGRRVFLNITSLIDVVFMLLMFFFISSTFIEQPGMKLDLPSAKSADLTQIESYLLYIYADGNMRLNEQEVTIENLAETLKPAANKLSETTLHLFADENVPHGKVVKVMDIAKQAGVKKLAIATIPEASE